MKCAECANFTLRAQPLAKLGMYSCKFVPKWQTNNPFIERECRDSREVPSEEIDARRAWAAGQIKPGIAKGKSHAKIA